MYLVGRWATSGAWREWTIENGKWKIVLKICIGAKNCTLRLLFHPRLTGEGSFSM